MRFLVFALLFLPAVVSFAGDVDCAAEWQYPWPSGRALYGHLAKDVWTQKPSAVDYAQTLVNSNYQILRGLPPVQSRLITADSRGKVRFLQRINGEWRKSDGENIPADVQARLESLYQKSVSVLGPNANLAAAEIRYGYPGARGNEPFHYDSGPHYIVVDAWDGPKTYIQSREGHIFEVEPNDAVIFRIEDTLHAFPDKEVPSPERVFVRLGFINS